MVCFAYAGGAPVPRLHGVAGKWIKMDQKNHDVLELEPVVQGVSCSKTPAWMHLIILMHLGCGGTTQEATVSY